MNTQSEILSYMLDAVYLIRIKDGIIVYTNDEFENMFGYARNEMVGEHVSIVNAPTDRSPEETVKDIMSVLADSGKWEGKVNNIRKDGSRFWCYASVSVFEHPQFGEVLISVHRDITNQLEAEEKIINERNKAQQYLNIANVMLLSINCSGIVTFINKKGCEVLECAEDEIVGHNWFDNFVPDSLREDLRELAMKIFSGENELFKYHENDILTKSGKRKLIAWHNSILKHDNGEIIGTLSSGEDITESNKAKEALLEKTNFINRIIDSSALSTLVSDKSGTAIMANPACLKFYGVSETEIIGKYNLFKDAVLEQQGFMPQIKAVFEKGEVVNIIINYDFGTIDLSDEKTDTHKIINSIFTPVLNNNNQVSNVIVQSTDLTELRKGEESILRNEAKFKGVFDSKLTGILFWNADGEITDVNQAFLDIVGYTKNEIIDGINNTKDITFPEYHEHNLKLLKELTSGAYISPIEKEYFHKDGNRIPILIGVATLPGTENNGVAYVLDISARKSTENQLRAEMEFTNTVLDAQSDTFFLFEPDTGKAIRWNRAFKEISGYSDKEIAEMPAPESYYSPNDLERASAFIQNMLNERTGTIELELICKDGSRVPSEYQVSVIDNYKGEPGYLISVGRDVSERKKAEKALQDSEEKFRTLVTSSEEIIYMIDKDGYFLLSEGKGLSKLGVKPGQVVGHSVFELYKDYPNMLNEMTKTFNGETVGFEMKMGDIYFRNWYTPHINNDGEIIGLLGLSINITERMLVEEKLKESERRFSMLIQQSPSVIEIYDKDGLQISVNKAYEELWRFPASRTLHKFNVLKSKEVEKSGLLKYIKRAYGGEAVSVPDYRFDPTGETEAQGAGRVRWLATKIYPLKDNLEVVNNIVITHSDVTDRKQAQEELTKHHEHLEELIKDRTRELEEKNKELDNTLKVFVGRELTIKDLQNRLKALGGS